MLTARKLFCLATIALAICCTHAVPARAAGITVNDLGDAPDAVPGDGICETAPGNGLCSLRAAVMEANALPGTDDITFAVNGVISLNTAGTYENEAASGDLDLRESVRIIGNGPEHTIVDGIGSDRVFHIIDSSYTAGAVHVRLEGMTIRNGHLRENGAGLYAADFASLELANTVVTGNSSPANDYYGGGGVYMGYGGALTVTQSDIVSNAVGYGGAGIDSQSNVWISQSRIEGNRSEVNGYMSGYGGGIRVNSDIVNIEDSVIADNVAATGGGLQTDGAHVIILRSAFSGNRAYDGGGFNPRNSTRVDVSYSAFVNNLADNGGGLFVGFRSGGYITNTTIAQNSAAYEGGGIYAVDYSDFPPGIYMNHVTLARNSAGDNGGGVYANAHVHVLRSIVAGNSATNGQDCQVNFGVGSFDSSGYSLVQDVAGCIGYSPAAGDVANQAPLLGTAINFGEQPGAFVLPPLVGSPALDAIPAACEPFDQRGAPRPVDGNGDSSALCDIGAFEQQFFPVGSLSGRVYADLDRNGAFGGADFGISGTQLFAGNAIALSDRDGTFVLGGLPAGILAVHEAQPSNYPDGHDTLGDAGGTLENDVFTVTLAAGQNANGYLFGEFAFARISGRIFEDRNVDGVFDSNDATLSGVAVTLTGITSDALEVQFVAFTDYEGMYLFGNLAPGIYTVTAQTPDGYHDYNEFAGSLGGMVAGEAPTYDVIGAIALNYGDLATGYDFSELGSRYVTLYEFADINENGAYDYSEAYIGNITFTISGFDYRGVFTSFAHVIDASGYSPNLEMVPGIYSVTASQPPGYLDGAESSCDSASGEIGNDAVRNIDLAHGLNGCFGFGERFDGISGRVYFDGNSNGTDDNEGGLTTIVALSGTTSAGASVWMTAETDGNGFFFFGNLLTGTYALSAGQVSLQYGYLPLVDGLERVGGSGGVTDTAVGWDVISGITFTPGQSAAGYTFGEMPGRRIRGMVFVDANADGQFNNYLCDYYGPGYFACDPTLRDVMIVLTGTDNFGASAWQTTSTGGPAYLFFPPNNYRDVYTFYVRPGAYSIIEVQPQGYADAFVDGPFGQHSVGDNRFDNVVVSQFGDPEFFSFGESAPGISGYVYFDGDNNGVRGNEGGIGGVQITLRYRSADGSTGISSTVTNFAGRYHFPVSFGGTFTLTEQPQGQNPLNTVLDGRESIAQLTDGRTFTATANDEYAGFVLPAGVSGGNFNFGELSPASIQLAVFHDRDANQRFDGSDQLIPGARVVLTGVTDLGPTGPFTYDVNCFGAGGNICINNLRPGEYALQLLPMGGYDAFTTTIDIYDSGTGGMGSQRRIEGLTLRPGTTANGYGFGELRRGISGFVYRDSNHNLMRDVENGPYADVTVILSGTEGSALLLTAPADYYGGFYEFANVPAGRYELRTTAVGANLPATLLDFFEQAGSAGGTAVNVIGQDVITGIVYDGEGAAHNYNFGKVEPATMFGYVYLDLDNDGYYNIGGEAPIPDVTLVLSGTDELGTAILLTTTSRPDGYFTFDGLYNAIYELNEIQPDGYADGRDTYTFYIDYIRNAGNDRFVISATVNGGSTYGGYMYFGERQSGLTGYVYVDLNNDGNKDINEGGIAGATITLSGTTNGATGFVTSTISNQSGFYSFADVPGGVYSLIEEQPAGYSDGQDQAGSAGGAVGNDVIAGIVITEATFGQDYLFGERLPARISGIVYVDVNESGEYDAGDAAISGVTLTIQGFDLQGQPVLTTARSGDFGFFSFDVLPAGTFTLTEQQPAGYADGPDRYPNGAPAELNDAFANITLVNGQSAGHYYFGERIVSLRGAVIHDQNVNGAADATEPGLEGVTIVLTGVLATDGSTVVSSTTTQAGGVWQFLALSSGVYTVAERQPAAYLDEAALAGNLGGDASENQIAGIVITGISGNGYTFLDVRNGSLAGNVYHDLNNNAALDNGEPGIAGVTVTLTGADFRGDNVSRSGTSGGTNGRYSFGALAPGVYTITAEQPDDYTDGREMRGTAGGVLGNDIISQIVISSGFDADGYLFGERQVGLAGFVYVDANNDGARGTFEPGLGGVQVELSGTTDLGVPAFFSTTTAGNGLFAFGDVPTGTFALRALQAMAYLDGRDVAGSAGGATAVNSADDVIAGIVITQSTFGSGYLFGEIPPARLHGDVFIDLDGDGRRDEGEIGIAGVTMTLAGVDDRFNGVSRVVSTTSTGEFEFASLRPGVYAITETQPAGYGDGPDRDAMGNFGARNDGFDGVFLSVGASVGRFTFGESTNFIAGSVFLDANNDGAYGAGDAALGGVTVRLTGVRAGDGGPVNLVTSTNGAGVWQFVNLPFGTYTITENQPQNVLDGREQPGSLGGVAGNDQFTGIVLSGAPATGYNFGELLPAMLRGRVYHDANGNDAPDGGEAGIAQVRITLIGSDDRGAAINRNAATDENGGFSFANLRPGSYTLIQTQPAEYTQGEVAAGGAGGSISGDAISNIAILPGTNVDGYRYGEKQFGLSGYVFYDGNNNGLRDSGEAGVDSVIIVLTGTTDTGGALNRNVQSNGGGYYNFANVPAGSYRIRELQPFGLFDGREQAGSLGGAVLQDAFDVTLGANQSGRDYNFGELAPAAVRGSVYLDVNNDGQQQAGEPGIPEAQLTLSGTDDLGASVARVVFSDDGGRFGFGNLRPGTYAISETQPAAFVDGLDRAGNAGGSVGNDLLSAIMLAPGANPDGYQFGERIVGFSGYVYADNNNNGTRASGEAGIDNVSMLLTGHTAGGAAITRTTLTAGGGFYAFGDLPAGTYLVTEVQPGGWLDGRESVGGFGGTAGPAGSDFISVTFAGGYGEGYNFGEIRPGRVAGYVFFDINDDGHFQWADCPDDSGLCAGNLDIPERGVGAGVTVVLNGSNDLGQSVVMTVSTQDNGYWEFPNLRPGTYSVLEVQRDVDVDGKDTRLIATRVTTPALNNNVLEDLALPVGGLVGGVFGEQPSIMGYVFRDDNDNGLHEPDGFICSTPELGVGGAAIRLSGVDIYNRSVSLGTTSTSVRANQSCNEGLWYFGGLVTGTYDIREIQPARYLDGREHVGNGGGLTTTNDIFSRIVFTPGRVITGYTFGELRNYISGRVYLDVNGDGAYTFGVDASSLQATILLTGVTDIGSVITRSTQSFGDYEFTGLRPGVYTVTQLQPEDFDDAGETLGGGIGVTARIAGNDQFIITLTAGAIAEGFDFGEIISGSIGGSVTYWPFPDWAYAYRTRPMPGELIQLEGVTYSGDAILLTATTDFNGAYSFADLAPGVYNVTQLSHPDGYTHEDSGMCGANYDRVDRRHIAISLNYGGGRFCQFRVGPPLRGAVFVDNNGDGFGDGGAIGGVRIDLGGAQSGGAVVTQSTTSAGCGLYEPCGLFAFAPLRSGTYAITETQPSYEDGGDFAGTHGGVTASLRITPEGAVISDVISGISYTYSPFEFASNYRFGERSPGSIMARVNYDRNENGRADDENGFIPNALVRLTGLNDLGQTVDITRSSSQRDGLIWGGLRPGVYTLTAQQPEGYTDWVDVAGDRGGEVTNDQIAGIVLTWGDGANGYAFHERRSGILGTVFGDLNNNGIYESFAGESGISSVVITLTGNSILGGPVMLTTTTDGRGIFAFADLGAGTYALSEQQPPAGQYRDGKDRAGTLGGNAAQGIGDDAIGNVVLDQQLFGDCYTFGEVPLGSLSGYVFVDGNNNGVRDGEQGIGGVIITLTGQLNAGGQVVLSQTTASSGAFAFASLEAGTYALAEAQPDFLDGLDAAGSAGGVALNDQIVGIAIRAGTRATDYRFGERATGISGYIYRDDNSDGMRQITETGLSPVTVRLIGRDFAGNSVNRSANTNNSGFYIFDVAPGTYTLEELQPFGYLTGTASTGSHGGTVINGNIISDVALPSGVAGLNYDFGDLAPTASDLAQALGLNSSQLLSATLDVDGANKAGIGGLTRPALLGYPTEGGTFVYLGTGNMIYADQANAQPNTFGIGDYARLSISLTVPATATCMALDFTFMSEEFPEFTGSQFNDAFEAYLDGMPFARDAQGNRITINSVFGASPVNSAGSTYDAGTVRLRAQTPVTPGAASLLTFVISDAVDTAYDSAALLDRVRFSAPGGRGCDSGANYPINLVLTHTVNNAPVDAGQREITVNSGEEVFHIYTVQNTGDYALTRHTLSDSALGPQFTDMPLMLAPGETYEFIASRVETATSVAEAIWTGYFSGTLGASARDTATVTVRQAPAPTPTPLPGSARLGILPAQVTIEAGQRISLALAISDVLRFGGFEAEIGFDPAVVTMTRVTLSDLPAGTGRALLPLATVHGAGWARFGAATVGASAGFSGDGVLAWLEFEGLSPGGASVIDLRGTIVTNDRSQRVSVSEADAIITVLAATPTGTSTPLASATSTATATAFATSTATATPTPTPVATTTETASPGPTLTPTNTPTPTASTQPTSTPTQTPTTGVGTATPTETPGSCSTHCTGAVTNMSLQVIYRSNSAAANASQERVRVRVARSGDGQGTLNPTGAVLFDNDPDGIGTGSAPNPVLGAGALLGFNVPAGSARIVVSVQGANHPQEYVKAVFATDCSQLPGKVDGNSYIGLMVTELSSSAGTYAGIARRAEAEYGQFGGQPHAYTNGAASGYRAVGNMDGVGQGLTVTVNAPTAGLYQLRIRYSSDTGVTNRRNVYLNGALVGSNMAFPNTGEWDDFTTATLNDVALNPGANTVRIWRDAASQPGTIDVDYIEVRATRDCTGATPTPGPTATPTHTPTTTPSPTPTATPLAITCAKEGDCFRVEFLGYVAVPGGETQLSWRVTNKCRHDVSYVAFGTDDAQRTVPANGSLFAGTLGNHLVTWTNNSGNPGFKSFKFSPVNNAFNFSESEVYTYRVRNFDPGERIRVKVHAGRVTETTSWQFNTANCTCSELPNIASSGGMVMTMFANPPAGSSVTPGQRVTYYVLLERGTSLARVGEESPAVIAGGIPAGVLVDGSEISDGGLVNGDAVVWTEALTDDDSVLKVYSVHVTEELSRSGRIFVSNQALATLDGGETRSNVVTHRLGTTASSVYLPVVTR